MFQSPNHLRTIISDDVVSYPIVKKKIKILSNSVLNYNRELNKILVHKFLLNLIVLYTT